MGSMGSMCCHGADGYTCSSATSVTRFVGRIPCLLGARIGGDPLGAPVGGTVALIAMVALILPPSAWAGATGPPEGTVVYRAVLSDPLGSGSVLLDGSGERVRHTVFRPFGAVYEEVGPGFGTSRLDRRYFAGHASQEETGLVFMQARWLDPEVGRFLSVDPLIRSLAKPQSLNGYSYVENNPTRFVDPTGMAAGPSGADPFAGVPEFPAAPPGAPIDNPSPSSFLAAGVVVGVGIAVAPEAAAAAAAAGIALLAAGLLAHIVNSIGNMTMSSESSGSGEGGQEGGEKGDSESEDSDSVPRVELNSDGSLKTPDPLRDTTEEVRTPQQFPMPDETKSSLIRDIADFLDGLM